MAASNSDCAISSQTKPASGDAQVRGTRSLEQRNAKIGHLLFDSGVITSDQLETALATALEYHQPITRVLNVQHGISEISLESAQQAQRSIDSLTVDRDAAISALKTSLHGGLPFEYVVARTESNPVDCSDFSDVELILFQSKIVSAAAIKETRDFSLEKDVPLGTALFMQRSVQFSHINSAFECLYFIERGWLTKANAIRTMSIVKCDNVDLKEALEQQGFAASNILSRIKIGDLLLQTKLIDETNLLTKLEQSLRSKRLLGSLLLESELVDQDHLIDVLIMQNFCAKDLIDKHTAIKMLRKSLEGKRDLATLANEHNLFRDDPLTAGGARQLLLTAGLITLDEIDQAEARYYTYGMDCLHAIVAAGFVSPTERSAAIECSDQLLRNLLTESESILVLQKCNGSDFDLQEEFQILPTAGRQERDRRLDQAITRGFKTNSHSLRPPLYKSAEFLILTTVATFAACGVAMSVLSRNFNTNGYSFVLITLFALLAASQIGRRWRRTVNAARLKNEVQSETAKATVKRLSHSKRKLA
ncbi:MAG: hypothetical protein SGJ27_26045 [Candidatus Melainabacteria bacterium]|nr:hypothetical protein [Candidatus Melainabacteria bacterium]